MKLEEEEGEVEAAKNMINMDNPADSYISTSHYAYDPMFDADPYNLTASLRFPTQFTFSGGFDGVIYMRRVRCMQRFLARQLEDTNTESGNVDGGGDSFRDSKDNTSLEGGKSGHGSEDDTRRGD